MLNQPTLEKLNLMKLHGMADAFRAQLASTDVSQLAFEERFGLLVDQQWLWKENRALAHRLHTARLKERGVVEDIDYQHPRGLDRKLMRTLANSEWVRQHQNILLIGPTGIGKTWLGCALAQKACRDGFSVLHKRTTELFRELAVAHVDGTIGRLLLKLSRVDVLVLDDFAMAPLKDSERRDILEICDDRYQRRSMILTSQMPVAHWHEQIGDPSVADSILDRLVHNAYRIELTGECLYTTHGNRTNASLPPVRPFMVAPLSRQNPGYLPAVLLALLESLAPGGGTPKVKLPALHQAADLRPCPLTRAEGLQVAAAVIHALQGYRKNPDYRTIQNDLRFVCDVLQRASAGETIDIARLRE